MRAAWPCLLVVAGCEMLAGLGDFDDAPGAAAAGGSGGTAVSSSTASSGGGGGGGRGGTAATGGDPTQGFGEATVIADQLAYPLGMALDDTHVYVTENRGTSRVLRLPHDGGAAPTPLASEQAAPWGIVVDDTYAYYFSRDDVTLRRIPKAGGTVDMIATVEEKAMTNVTGIALADGTVYLADEANGIVAIEATPGSTASYLATTVGTPSDVRVQGGFVYTNDKTGNVYRIDRSTEEVTPMATGLLNPLGFDLAANSLFICEKDADQVTRVPLDGGGAEVVAVVPEPHRLATDGAYVYVTERESCGIPGRVYAIDLADGSFDVIAEGLNCPLGIEVNDEAIYILNTGNFYQTEGSVLRIPKL